MINEYGRRIMVRVESGYRPATPAEVEAVKQVNGKLSVSCIEGHLMTEANTYRATIGGYPRRFCRICKRVRKAGDKVRAQIKAEDTTNPTFPCGHSARSDGGNILPWRDKWLCLLCTTKKDVARRRADIKWLRNNEAKARARYGSLNQIESQIKRHEEKIAVHEAYLARIEGVTTTTTNHAELLTNDEARTYKVVHARRYFADHATFPPLCNVYTERFYWSAIPSEITCLLCLKRLRKLETLGGIAA